MADSKIEQYLIDMMLSYQPIGPNLWMLDDQEHGLPGVVVMHAESLVIVSAEIMDAPQNEKRLELFTKLLELNATDILHGAYALEKEKIILIDTLEVETMDFGDFRGTLDAFSLDLAQHYPILSKYRENV
jgi:hypothetical protein